MHSNIGGAAYPAILELLLSNSKRLYPGVRTRTQVGNTWLVDIGLHGTSGTALGAGDRSQTDVSNASAAVQSPLAACQAGSCLSPIPYLSNFGYTQSAGSSTTTPYRPRSNGDSPRGSPSWLPTPIESSFILLRLSVMPVMPTSRRTPMTWRNRISTFPQRLSLAYIWNMPFGSTFAKLQDQCLNHLIQGWEAGGVLTVQSGPPFTPVVSETLAVRMRSITPRCRLGCRVIRIVPKHHRSMFYPAKKTPSSGCCPRPSAPRASLTSAMPAGTWRVRIGELRFPSFGISDERIRQGPVSRGDFQHVQTGRTFDIPQNIAERLQLRPNLQYGPTGRGPGFRRTGEPRELQLGLWWNFLVSVKPIRNSKNRSSKLKVWRSHCYPRESGEFPVSDNHHLRRCHTCEGRVRRVSIFELRISSCSSGESTKGNRSGCSAKKGQWAISFRAPFTCFSWVVEGHGKGRCCFLHSGSCRTGSTSM